MTVDERQLNKLLALVSEQVDLDQCKQVDERYRRALSWREVDRPPLVVQPKTGPVFDLPKPWSEFAYYPYHVAFHEPAAMMQNMLLARVVPGLLLKDDSPLAIRNDHGTIQMASLLGGGWELTEDNYPWVRHVEDREALERIASGERDVDLAAGGLLSPSMATLRFYRQKLADYPPCEQAIQISLPDLQGPLDTAHQLWGTDMFIAFYDEPELLSAMLGRIVVAMVAVAARYVFYIRDRLAPEAATQHGYVIPGSLLIRDDSAIMISAETYAESVMAHDARLLENVGGGAIHFCGNGEHLIEVMRDIPDLRGLDFGESFTMDMQRAYALCRERQVAITNLEPPLEQLLDGSARARYPTGVVMARLAENWREAEEVAETYCRRGA